MHFEEWVIQTEHVQLDFSCQKFSQREDKRQLFWQFYPQEIEFHNCQSTVSDLAVGVRILAQRVIECNIRDKRDVDWIELFGL